MHSLPALDVDMDFDTYLRDPMDEPSLNSSLVKALLSKTPRKVWQETSRLNRDATEETKTAFDLGSAAHRLFTGTGSPIVVIDAPSFQSARAKSERDAAYNDGKTPILRGDMPRVQAMAKAALDQIRDSDDIGHLFRPEMMAEMLREATILWREGGVGHRCRPDFYNERENVMIHYKTTATDIAPNTTAMFAAKQGWDMIAAHYGAGGNAWRGSWPRQLFFVQETVEPYLGMTVELDNTFLEVAKMRRERAILIWARCLRENVWPGLPTKTVKVECPEWHERNMVADKDAENDAAQGGNDLLDMMRRWQAPEGWNAPAVQGDKRDERDVIQ